MEKVDSAAVDAATEAKALGKLVEALDGLDRDATRRVLDWAWKRYIGGGVPDGGRQRASKIEPPRGNGGGGGAEDVPYADLAELYNAASPKTDAEKVLVVGYWHQVSDAKANLDAQAINTDLKDMGHRVGNVTRACSVLINEKPQLMIQVKKSGSTKQARKQYRITAAGLQRVREMLANGHADHDGA